MKNRTKKILLILIFGALSLGGLFYFLVWLPNTKLGDLDFLENATSEEQREVAHKVLRFPLGNHHDAYQILVEIGNESSIPYLLNRLKDYDHDNDIRECTETHCLEALREITGKDFGFDFEKWKEEIDNN